MTTEEGIVIRTDADTAWIKTTRTGGCNDCSARGSCHTLGGGKEMEVSALNTAGAHIGDRVLIGFDTGSLLKVQFLLYILPILALMAGAAVGNGIAPYLSLNSTALSIVIGFASLALSLLFIRVKGNRLARKSEYRPKVLRVLPTPNGPAC